MPASVVSFALDARNVRGSRAQRRDAWFGIGCGMIPRERERERCDSHCLVVFIPPIFLRHFKASRVVMAILMNAPSGREELCASRCSCLRSDPQAASHGARGGRIPPRAHQAHALAHATRAQKREAGEHPHVVPTQRTAFVRSQPCPAVPCPDGLQRGATGSTPTSYRPCDSIRDIGQMRHCSGVTRTTKLEHSRPEQNKWMAARKRNRNSGGIRIEAMILSGR